MEQEKDIVERLRETFSNEIDHSFFEEAADEIERLRKKVIENNEAAKYWSAKYRGQGRGTERLEHEENDLEMVGTIGSTVSLDDLVGGHLLDGVDMFSERVETWGNYEDASCIRFRLDGITYTAVEDPEDGYRSCLDRLFVDSAPIKNSFQPLKVVARKKADDPWRNDTLELIDADNGNTVLEVGTDNADDYYPSFVASFWPERMSINNPKDYPA